MYVYIHKYRRRCSVIPFSYDQTYPCILMHMHIRLNVVVPLWHDQTYACKGLCDKLLSNLSANALEFVPVGTTFLRIVDGKCIKSERKDRLVECECAAGFTGDKCEKSKYLY